MAELEHVLVEQHGASLHIQLKRPDKKNALSLAMYRRITEAISQAERAGSIRVLVFRGLPGCFSSGNDLADFTQLLSQPDKLDSPDNPILTFMHKLANCSKPVVAVVDGMAVGIGTTLLLHCDLVYCSSQASFSLPFTNLGLCPEYASSLLLPRLAGHVKAAEWLMLGENISAEEACRVGLVNAVAAQLNEYAQAKIDSLMQQPPEALRVCKQLLKAETRGRADKVIANELALFKQALAGAEFAEAVAAFFEKRPADFSQFE